MKGTVFRNNITIAVTYDGEMWVAKGSAQIILTDPNGMMASKISDIEEGLGFGQLAHRTIAKVEDGYIIARPRDLRGAVYGPTFATSNLFGGEVLKVGHAYENDLFNGESGKSD